MTWRPVLVGVDGSAEGIEAAVAAGRIAAAAGAPLIPVHAIRGRARLPAGLLSEPNASTLAHGLIDAARAALAADLRERIPASAIERLEVLEGHPARVLQDAVRQHGAGLLVLGGKRHAPPVRWFGGSTVHNAVRTADVPVLVVAGPVGGFDRLLAAIDFSDATSLTLDWAQRFAALFGATVKPIHVVEPLPTIPDGAVDLDEETHLRLAEEGVRDAIADATVEAPDVVCHGSPARAIAEAAAAWPADLVIVGTHGRGWVDRVLLGSTTERLLNRLPASVLVIPTAAAGGGDAAPIS